MEESHEITSLSWAAISATSAGRAVLPTRKQGISWRGKRERRIGPGESGGVSERNLM